MWKPGQLVTIDRHVYRIKKRDKINYPGLGSCMQCKKNARDKENDAPCEMYYGKPRHLTPWFCRNKTPYSCYLDLVYPVRG